VLVLLPLFVLFLLLLLPLVFLLLLLLDHQTNLLADKYDAYLVRQDHIA
jgi:hypothetical protein